MFGFWYDFCCSVVNNFNFFVLKLIIFIAYSLKDSQNFFMQCLHFHTSCLVSMLLNDDIVEIEKSDGICLPTFLLNEFTRLFLHPSVFSIKH